MTAPVTRVEYANVVPLFPSPRRGKQSARVGWIVAPNGCHLWQGTHNRGYGVVWIGKKMRVVHKLRYEERFGAVPDGMHLDHFACDTPQCCNPEHVRPVTPRENALRGRTIAAAHAARTHCPKGHPLEAGNLLAHRGTHAGWRSCKTCHNTASRERRKAMTIYRRTITERVLAPQEEET